MATPRQCTSKPCKWPHADIDVDVIRLWTRTDQMSIVFVLDRLNPFNRCGRSKWLTKQRPIATLFFMKIPTVAKLFDHSILRPDTNRHELLRAAETSVRLKTATLMVQPCNLQGAGEVLKGSGVLLASVIGFPHGNETPSMKEYQTNEAMRLGAQEIDMVMNIPALKNDDKNVFLADIEGVVRAAQGFKVKVILENCLLTNEEKRRACAWIAEAGAHFVKTSTGFAAGGATVEDVQLMSVAVAGRCEVKAAGGVKTIEEVLAFLKAGARRFGSTRSDQIIQTYRELSADKRKEFGEFVTDLDA
jgi:deoxyribose-phosphate aldolase